MTHYKVTWEMVEQIGEAVLEGVLVVDAIAPPTLTDDKGRVYPFVIEETKGGLPTAKATMEALGRKAVVLCGVFGDRERYYLFAEPEVPEGEQTIRMD